MNKKIVLMLVVAMSAGAFTQMAVAQTAASGAETLLSPAAADPAASIDAKIDTAQANAKKAQAAVDTAQANVAKVKANVNPVRVGGDSLVATPHVTTEAKKAAVKYAPVPTAVQRGQAEQAQQALTLLGAPAVAGGDKP